MFSTFTILLWIQVLFKLHTAFTQSNKSSLQNHKLGKSDDSHEDYCKLNVTEEEESTCLKINDYMEGLYRWDPVETGHVREIVIRGEKRKMITRAKEPPVFEIPDFLSADECSHIKRLAMDTGLISSETHEDEETRKFRKRRKSGKHMEYFGSFAVWDLNNDHVITELEMQEFIKIFKHLYLDEKDIGMMIDFLDFHELFEDGGITYDEWDQVPVNDIDDYLTDVQEKDPKHMHRFSQQTWLHQTAIHDHVLAEIREKVLELTKLHPQIINGAEPLQVLRYGPRGHYHAHYDSQTINDTHLECCHFDKDAAPNCRLCRYMTIFYYLDDVEEGGETAFPVADKNNFNETEFRERKNGDYYNLSHHCQDSLVVITPKKGSAVMWYNHLLDKDGKWLGEMDQRSLHGGCDVRNGVKWAANNWIVAPQQETAHKRSFYLRKG